MGAEAINAHLRSGGVVQLTTYAISRLYTKRHAGWFSTGADGNVYVREGKGRVCLTMAGGGTWLVAVRLGREGE